MLIHESTHCTVSPPHVHVHGCTYCIDMVVECYDNGLLRTPGTLIRPDRSSMQCNLHTVC